jgi:hypothetical protein
MDDSFRTFLQSSKPGSKSEVKVVSENKNVVNSDPRVKVLQEKVSYFCKKYGEIGADALDDFFRESVEKFSGFKSIKTNETSVPVVETKIPTDPLERANAILMGESNPHPSPKNKTQSKGDDIMARAMAIMG